MQQAENLEQNGNTIQTLNVIYESSLRGPSAISKEDVFAYPLYKVIKPGVLKLDPGVKRHPADVFVFVVDGAPSWFMDKYKLLVRQMPVFKTVVETSVAPANYPVKITTLLPICGVYESLEGTMVDALGHDFVCLTNTESGTKIEPLNGDFIGDVYLRVDTETLSEDLLGIISVDLVELIEKQNGLYTVVGAEPTNEKTI